MMPRDIAGEKVGIVIDKLQDSQPDRIALRIPCANGPCQEPALHVVSGNFDYPEKVKSKMPGVGFRWETRTESFLLYFCRDHRDKWLRKKTVVTVGGGLL